MMIKRLELRKIKAKKLLYTNVYTLWLVVLYLIDFIEIDWACSIPFTRSITSSSNIPLRLPHPVNTSFHAQSCFSLVLCYRLVVKISGQETIRRSGNYMSKP